jgi:hypothetical protein
MADNEFPISHEITLHPADMIAFDDLRISFHRTKKLPNMRLTALPSAQGRYSLHVVLQLEARVSLQAFDPKGVVFAMLGEEPLLSLTTCIL